MKEFEQTPQLTLEQLYGLLQQKALEQESPNTLQYNDADIMYVQALAAQATDIYTIDKLAQLLELYPNVEVAVHSPHSGCPLDLPRIATAYASYVQALEDMQEARSLTPEELVDLRATVQEVKAFVDPTKYRTQSEQRDLQRDALDVSAPWNSRLPLRFKTNQLPQLMNRLDLVDSLRTRVHELRPDEPRSDTV